MIEELKRIKYNFFPLILFFTIFLYLIIAKPYIDDNTYTYTQFTLIRQPVYSIFLNSFRWAGEHQFQLIMWVQGLLTFLSLLYARRWLKTRLALSDYFILPVFFIILFTISFYYQIRSVDDPEGITFPIFIITFFILLECFYHFEIKKIIYLNFLVSLLILTRTQFYFFYPITAILLFWQLWKHAPKKFIMSSILLFLGFGILTNVTDRLYHQYMNGFFINEPFSGLLLVIQPLYLAKQNSFQYFENAKTRDIVRDFQDEIDRKKWGVGTVKLPKNSIQFYKYATMDYNKQYVPIQRIVNYVLTNTTFENIYQVSNAKLIEINNLLESISKTLFLKNIKENIFLYFYKIVDGMGNIPVVIFFLLLFAVSTINLLINRTNEFEVQKVFIFLILLIIFFNTMVIAVAEPNCVRYYCYTQFLLYCFAAYLGQRIFLLVKNVDTKCRYKEI